MQYSLALFALLGAASALPEIRPNAPGYPESNSTSTAKDCTSTNASGSATVPSYSGSTSKVNPPPYPTGSAPPYPQPYPTGSAPSYPLPSGGIWTRPQPVPTGSNPQQTSSYSTASTATEYLTKTTSFPITTTITRHVPCSTQVSSNGQSWWSTYLTASYHTTSYVTTKTSVVPAPTANPVPSYGECPAPVTVTKTVTEFVGLPSARPEEPSRPLTTKTLTLTLDYEHTTIITVSYPIPTSTTSRIIPKPPYPTTSSTGPYVYPTGGYPQPSGGYPQPSGGYPQPSGGYPYPTGVTGPSASSSQIKPTGTGYVPSSSSSTCSTSTAIPTYY